MIKSPLRYPGGKSRAIPLISELIPDFDEFREPFLGGGSVFVYLKQRFPNKKFWINDLYTDLFVFWKEAQKDVGGVVKQINNWRNKYSDGKELYKFLKGNIDKFDGTQRAAAFFVINRVSFSGTTLSGGFSEMAFKQRFTESSIQRLEEFGKVIQDAKITNYDYEVLTDSEGENVFLFLDPPYYSATKSALYGKNGALHKAFDHERFAKTMRRCKHKWLITYDDSDYIRDLFSFANVMPWDLTYGMRNVSQKSNQLGNEIFVSNYLEVLPEKRQLDMFAKVREKIILD